MSIVGFIVVVAVVGVVLWVVNSMIPMPAPIKTVLNVGVALLLLLYLLNALGMFGGGPVVAH
jgi:uncharacterized protein YhhL (DUF1145 family)